MTKTRRIQLKFTFLQWHPDNSVVTKMKCWEAVVSIESIWHIFISCVSFQTYNGRWILHTINFTIEHFKWLGWVVHRITWLLFAAKHSGFIKPLVTFVVSFIAFAKHYTTFVHHLPTEFDVHFSNWIENVWALCWIRRCDANKCVNTLFAINYKFTNIWCA